jgi:hypothetical protein
MARRNGISRRDLLRAGCCTAASFGMTAALGRLNMIHALATWFGVGAADLPTVFPNLPNFTTSTLSFLG